MRLRAALIVGAATTTVLAASIVGATTAFAREPIYRCRPTAPGITISASMDGAVWTGTGTLVREIWGEFNGASNCVYRGPKFQSSARSGQTTQIGTHEWRDRKQLYAT